MFAVSIIIIVIAILVVISLGIIRNGFFYCTVGRLLRVNRVKS